jgi:hypothetical protein
LLALGVTLGACGGSSSPTEPTVALFKVGAAGSISNMNSAMTILQAQALFEGYVVGDTTYDSGTVAAAFSANITGVPAGQHTYTIRVVRQTGTSAPYQLIGMIQVWNAAGQIVYSANISSAVQIITTSGGIDYTFKF